MARHNKAPADGRNAGAMLSRQLQTLAKYPQGTFGMQVKLQPLEDSSVANRTVFLGSVLIRLKDYLWFQALLQIIGLRASPVPSSRSMNFALIRLPSL